jgi:type IV pilus assembly protein PilA
MNMRNKKGFTLVEIMIVVVIIGLLAAMAIPAFQKVRESSRESTLINDARQLGAAAQQYLLESGETSVSIDYTSETGVLGAPLDEYLRAIGTGYTIQDTITINASFTMSHAQVSGGGDYTFRPEGTLESKP